ncbi:hypothetical protein [Leisingera sp.]|uniref:hypothetical protein n=1 Tax=Leisingera sp. TaxID=1879318 RepID=UPI002B27358D|nr:hypothetical protein [Leisingera sp.]
MLTVLDRAAFADASTFSSDQSGSFHLLVGATLYRQPDTLSNSLKAYGSHPA